jgi:hypothetical protein
MKTTNLLMIGALAATLTACIPSLKPFYTAKDVVFEQALLGEWEATDDGAEPARWRFETGETNQYRLTIREKGDKQGDFKATLFRLKQYTFLDLIPASVEFSPKQVDLVGMSVIPGHLVARVIQTQPTLKLALFDFDKLAKILKENPEALAHDREDERIVLTADTPALQKFLLQHVEGDALFAEPGVLVKKP